MFTRINIGDRERALVIRSGRFLKILEPGTHFVFAMPFTVDVERHSINDRKLSSTWTEFLVKERRELAERYFVIVETGDREVAIIYADGKFAEILGPGSRALYWKSAASIGVRVIDVFAEPEVPREALRSIAYAGNFPLITGALVEEGKAGLLFLENRYVRSLGPGMYAFWKPASPRVEGFDLRVQTLEVTGQEILTKDKVSLRVNITAEYRISDPVALRMSVASSQEHLHRSLQLALRRSLGAMTLEDLLARKTEVEPEVAADIRADFAAIGVELRSLALKDIVLPGDMREMLNQVVAAEKQAQANLIRRREETAATRSLLNTAKLMEDNPILVRLKELETLEKLTTKVERIHVSGGFDGLLSELLPKGKP